MRVRTVISATLFCAMAIVFAGCEDGPDQIFKPNPSGVDPDKLNGNVPKGHIEEGTQPFVAQSSGQQDNTTVICEADELAVRWAAMVKEPILPTRGAGGLDLRGQPEWAGLSVDEAQQKLCQAYVYQDGLVFWGDNAELLASYDTKTRLIDRLITLTGYEGKISAGPFAISNNQPIMKNGTKLQNPTAAANLREMNNEFLKAFRGITEQRDCVAENTCYVLDWYTVKRFVFEDLALDFAIEPEGEKIDHIGINIKRSFDLTHTDVTFGAGTTAGLAPVPKVPWRTTCQPTLGTDWDYVVKNCLGGDPVEKALTRPVWSNEAMMADMGGLVLYMTRTLAPDQIVADDSKPETTDKVVGVGFTTEYTGSLALPAATLYDAFAAAVASKVKQVVPAVDEAALAAKLGQIEPAGDPDKLPLGTQSVEVCTAPESCTPGTLTIVAQQLTLDAVKTIPGQVIPDELRNANFYVEILLRQLFRMFNEEQDPTPAQIYFYVDDDSAQVLTGAFIRDFGGKRHAMRAVYHNKSDQLIFIFVKSGSLRTEDILWQDAEGKQYDNSTGDGTFRLWNLARSPRLGLGKELVPKQTYPATRRATVQVKVGTLPQDVLVSYTEQGSSSGFSIPIEGQRDVFVPAAAYGFSGTTVGATLLSTDGIIRGVASGAFYDQLDFCGVKVGLWDSVYDVLRQADCDKIVTYSDNGKLIDGVSTYVQTDPFKIGLRLWITADRVSAAYYWAEQ